MAMRVKKMKIKKMRGIKRRVAWALREVEADSAVFPVAFYEGLWHMHLPCLWQRATISLARYRRDCAKILLRRLEHFRKNKPDDGECYRVVVAILLPAFDESQLMVFRGDSYYKEFFDHFDGERFARLEPRTDWEAFIRSVVGTDCGIICRQMADTGERNGVVWFIGDVPNE